MLRPDNRDFSPTATYAIWMLMAFQAGYVNVGGLMVSGNFVSHVTGTSSQIGIGLANFDFLTLGTFLTILLAFIGGASFAGHFIERSADDPRPRQYILVLSIKSLFFGLALILSSPWIDYLGTGQAQANLLIMFFLSFCCGIQNATCTLATQGQLRPTHMTGLSTDLGLSLARALGWKDKGERYQEERKKILQRLSILLFFIFGGATSSVIFTQNGHYGLLFPFISSLCFLALGWIRENKPIHIQGPAIKAIKGTILATFMATLFFGLSGVFQ